jgi:hypothetical protein
LTHLSFADLPAPKRPVNGAAPPAPGRADGEMAGDLQLDAELPSLLGDLDLSEVLDAALAPAAPAGAAVGAAAQARSALLSLDLRDLPTPVGPRPRSRLSARVAADEAQARRRRISSPNLSADAANWLAAAKANPPSEAEPAPLPAPPAREPAAANAGPLAPGTAEALPPPPVGERPPFRPPVLDVVPLPAERLPGNQPAAAREPGGRPTEPLPRRASQPAIPTIPKPADGRRASQPAIPTIPKPADGRRISQPALPMVAKPADGRRASQPAIPLLGGRPTEPLPRRASQPAIPTLARPTESAAAAASSPLGTDDKKPEITLPPLPSDESGNPRPAGASMSDPSGLSVLSGAPPSSRVTPEARPVRMGYLIVGLAMLAILLAMLIFRIAGVIHKPTTPPSGEPPPAGAQL